MSKKFKPQDYFRYPKLGKRWRRPKGLQSKLRIKKGGSGMKPSVGYGSPWKPRAALIANEKDFQKDCSAGVLISSGAGSRKTLMLAAKAEELGITVLNMKKIKRAKKLSAEIKKKNETASKEKEKIIKEEKKKSLDRAEKKIGFHENTVPQVFDGKTKTYRIHDHQLHAGDNVAFENTQKGEIFGHAKITKVEQIPVNKINLKDSAHYTVYDKEDELVEALKRHNPDHSITAETKVFVYTYEFTPAKSGKKEAQ